MRISVQSAKIALQHWCGRWGTSFVDLVFPPSCLLCGVGLEELSAESRPHLCPTCIGTFGFGGAATCEVCTAPLPKVGASVANCLYCRERKYRFHAATALGTYRGPLRDAVLKMKTSAHEPLTLATGELLADKVQGWLTSSPPDIVVPIPMHWWKRWLRGTNSPDLIADTIGRRLRVPTSPRLLIVRRPAKKQGTLLPGERLKNVRGVFRVSTRYTIASKHVLLVDDVMTTGATVNEAAKVLRRAGAARVSVAVVARGVGEDSDGPR